MLWLGLNMLDTQTYTNATYMLIRTYVFFNVSIKNLTFLAIDIPVQKSNVFVKI